MRGLRTRLGPLLREHGDLDISELDARLLLKLKAGMRKRELSPIYINQTLCSAKRLVEWAAAMDLRPPANLKAVRGVPVPPPKNKAWPLATAKKLIEQTERWNPQAATWMRLQLLTAMRPSEVVRLVAGEGEWLQEGIFVLDESKTATRSKMPRHIVLSEAARKTLAQAEPVFSRLDSYSNACFRSCDHRPHRLRHTAATALMKAGEDRQVVDDLLGHVPSRVSATYMGYGMNWAKLIGAAQFLARLVDGDNRIVDIQA